MADTAATDTLRSALHDHDLHGRKRPVMRTDTPPSSWCSQQNHAAAASSGCLMLSPRRWQQHDHHHPPQAAADKGMVLMLACADSPGLRG